ncbi:MAG TPA: hypothetical protein VGE99_07550 [Candidatus Dormibacteraeota bacterium]
MQRDPDLNAEADVEEDDAPVHSGRAIALIAVVGLCVLLAALPPLIGFGLAPRPVGQVAGGFGSLVAVAVGVKVAAACWGPVARYVSSPAHRRIAASSDGSRG